VQKSIHKNALLAQVKSILMFYIFLFISDFTQNLSTKINFHLSLKTRFPHTAIQSYPHDFSYYVMQIEIDVCNIIYFR